MYRRHAMWQVRTSGRYGRQLVVHVAAVVAAVVVQPPGGREGGRESGVPVTLPPVEWRQRSANGWDKDTAMRVGQTQTQTPPHPPTFPPFPSFLPVLGPTADRPPSLPSCCVALARAHSTLHTSLSSFLVLTSSLLRCSSSCSNTSPSSIFHFLLLLARGKFSRELRSCIGNLVF